MSHALDPLPETPQTERRGLRYAGRKAAEESVGWRIPLHCNTVKTCFSDNIFLSIGSEPHKWR
jgi:hypothetical protein